MNTKESMEVKISLPYSFLPTLDCYLEIEMTVVYPCFYMNGADRPELLPWHCTTTKLHDPCNININLGRVKALQRFLQKSPS